jgi:hypothetical protein
MAAKIVVSTLVMVVCGTSVIEGEFRGEGVPVNADVSLVEAYRACKETTFQKIAAGMLDTLRRAAMDVVRVQILYTPTEVAVAVLEEESTK